VTIEYIRQATEVGQATSIDTGLQCLMMMTKLHGIAADVAQLQHQFGREKFTAQTD